MVFWYGDGIPILLAGCVTCSLCADVLPQVPFRSFEQAGVLKQRNIRKSVLLWSPRVCSSWWHP